MEPIGRPHLDLENRGRQILKGFEWRARHLVSALERGLTPWLRRLDLPSRREIRRLARQVSLLERRWQATQSQKKSSVVRLITSRRRPAPARKPMDSLRYAELFWDEV